MARTRFKIILIKPSHYDEAGYVIQWHRSRMSSASLAAAYDELAACAEAGALGPEVGIEVEPHDEANTVIYAKAMIASLRAAGAGVLALVGVRTHEYPRALDLARQFRAVGLPVVISGSHIHRCLSLETGAMPALQEALDLGLILHTGEGAMTGLLLDIAAGRAEPIYHSLAEPPDPDKTALPRLPRPSMARVLDHQAGIEAAGRSAGEVEAIVRSGTGQGIQHFFLTDDDFARNANWEPILDRLAALRREGLRIRLGLEVGPICHRMPGFIEKAAAAGVEAVVIALDSIGSDSGAEKIRDTRGMLQAWRARKVMTTAAYGLGFPTDTPDSIARDIETLKRELPVDMVAFFCVTPAPAPPKSPPVKAAAAEPDLNRYDLEHVTGSHPLMSAEVWSRVYRHAWLRYYADEHVAKVLRRARVSGLDSKQLVAAVTVFSGSVRIEGVHPLRAGSLRRKRRRGRRPGLPMENALKFYPRRIVESATSLLQWMKLARRYRKIRREVMAEGDGAAYSDEALTPDTP
jgi:hypothetical protein